MTSPKEQIEKSVNTFSHEMKQRLLDNSYKGDWTTCKLDFLIKRLDSKMGRFKQAVASVEYGVEIGEGSFDDLEASIGIAYKDAADLANFAMMVVEKLHKI